MNGGSYLYNLLWVLSDWYHNVEYDHAFLVEMVKGIAIDNLSNAQGVRVLVCLS